MVTAAGPLANNEMKLFTLQFYVTTDGHTVGFD